MASYIQFLESAGAKTVPLIFDGDLGDELAKIDHLNGVFYCGGEADKDYETFGKAVFAKVKAMNDDGIHMPIWGTCLGMENMASFVATVGK
jgi:gamma-glutamyl hydrolase